MLVSDIVSDVQNHFPEATSAQIVAILNKIHARLCQQFRLVVGRETLSAFVAGTGEYSLPANVAEIYQATWYDSSSSFMVLQPTTVQTLDTRQQGWRSMPSGYPLQYYVDGVLSVGGTQGTLGLYPAPSVSTSGGYPSLVLDVAYYQTLSSGSTMPPQVPSYDAWFFGVLSDLALQRNDARLKIYREREDEGITTLGQMVSQAQDARDRGMMIYDTRGPRRV